MVGSRVREVGILSGPLEGSRMRLRLGSEKAMWAGTYELDVQRELLELAPRAGLGYDIGAYVGFFSLLLDRICDSVVAVEPLPTNALRVRETAALNQAAIDVVEAVASDRDEAFVSFELGPTPSMGRIVGLGSASSTEPGVGQPLRIRSVTIAGLAQQYGPPSIVKIDVEGAAGLVVQGAGDALDHQPPVLVELHGDAERELVTRELLKRGYALHDVGGSWIAAT
jgi:FkbM family methyltransferase